MPGPEAKIGEEACRGAGSQNNLEVELQGYGFFWTIHSCSIFVFLSPASVDMSNQCLLLFGVHRHAKSDRQPVVEGEKMTKWNLNWINSLLMSKMKKMESQLNQLPLTDRRKSQKSRRSPFKWELFLSPVSQAAWKQFSGNCTPSSSSLFLNYLLLVQCSNLIICIKLCLFFSYCLLSQSHGADLYDLLDGAVHRPHVDGGCRREGEKDQGELEDGQPHPW